MCRPVSWYLRSFGDHDIHLGQLRGDGTVLPLCGVVFTPHKLVGDRLTLSGSHQIRSRSAHSATAVERAAQRALKQP
ncbi:MAG: hypothetical protein ACRDTH_04585 [Pseudonocardiaceae bacterium]